MFLLIGSPVEIFSFSSDGTSLRLVNRAEAPALPMLTDTRDSYFKVSFGKIAVSLITPASPRGLLSSTMVVIEVVMRNSLRKGM